MSDKPWKAIIFPDSGSDIIVSDDWSGFDIPSVSTIQMKSAKEVIKIVDMKDGWRVNAVVRAARDSGYTKLYLLDKTFVMNALADAIKTWKEKHDE